jgi:hypothetical protein
MKLFTSTFIALFAALTCAHAQASFTLTPQNVTVVVADSTHDAEGINTIQNLQNVSKIIKWTRTVICIDPSNAQTQICDLVTCYFPTISTRTFTLGPQVSGPIITHFLKVKGVPGSAIVALHFENTANAADSLTSLYVFNTCGVSATNEQLPAATVQMYPNPVSDFFTLQNAEEVAKIRLYTADGREVAAFNASADGQYPIAHLAAGTYYMGLFDKQARLFQAIKMDKR